MHQGFLSQYMGSDASKNSHDDYNEFVTPQFNHIKHGGAPDALSHHNGPATMFDKSVHPTAPAQDSMIFTSVRGEPLITQDFNPPKIVDKEEERAMQKVFANDNSMTIGMSAIGVSLLTLAAMLGVRMRRGLQQAIALAPAAAGNILELKTQEPIVRGQVGWSQQSSKNSHPLALCYAEYTLDDTPIGGPLEPTSNYILVRIDDGIDATKGGVFLPDQAKEKPSAGVVVAAGPGKAHPDTGVVVPIPVAEGDRVLYGKFDGTSVKYCGTDHQLMEDVDILLSWAGDAAMSLGNVKCVADNVLVQVTKFEEDTSSGIALAAGVSDQTRTSTGTVVKI